MKRIIDNYKFIPSERKIVFTDFSSISLERVLLVVNVTSNVLLYNFMSSSLGGSVSGNTLILDYDTSSMDASDTLMIFYDDELMDVPVLSGPAEDLEVHLQAGVTTAIPPSPPTQFPFTLLVSHQSDASVYIRFTSSTSGGVPLLAGDILNLNLSASQQVYAFSQDDVVLSVSWKAIAERGG